MSQSYPEPEILSEKGFDQTAVPSEQANETPNVRPEDIEAAAATSVLKRDDPSN